MRVSLTTYGGQAAAITMRQPARTLDTDTLPSGAAEELRGLVSAARAAPGGPPPRAAADAMHYTITVDDDDHAATLSASDAGMTKAFAALLGWIERHSG
jgi:hypothetical protein